MRTRCGRMICTWCMQFLVPVLPAHQAIAEISDDDAARQFLGFKTASCTSPNSKSCRIFMISHRDMPTGVPWGRGEWLDDLLALGACWPVLPAQSSASGRRLLEFFPRSVCRLSGSLQDGQGMWHQVLTHPDAYPETSCTSMFMYAFSARHYSLAGLPRQRSRISPPYSKPGKPSNRISIDKARQCATAYAARSEFSFSPEYDKKELLWTLPDPHGIGIVLLAGVEVIKLMEHLKKSA